MAKKDSTLNKKDEQIRQEMLSSRRQIVDKCEGCKDVDGNFCSCYIDPSILFNRGGCPRASHLAKAEEKSTEKIRVGQQKQKKKTRGK
jgi:hypothetical protein